MNIKNKKEKSGPYYLGSRPKNEAERDEKFSKKIKMQMLKMQS